jgi:hypothetical protein
MMIETSFGGLNPAQSTGEKANPKHPVRTPHIFKRPNSTRKTVTPNGKFGNGILGMKNLS